MIEQQINLWDADADNVLLCITTNGYVKNNGECVMGRGCALEAKTRWPDLPEEEWASHESFAFQGGPRF